MRDMATRSLTNRRSPPAARAGSMRKTMSVRETEPKAREVAAQLPAHTAAARSGGERAQREAATDRDDSWQVVVTAQQPQAESAQGGRRMVNDVVEAAAQSAPPATDASRRARGRTVQEAEQECESEEEQNPQSGGELPRREKDRASGDSSSEDIPIDSRQPKNGAVPTNESIHTQWETWPQGSETWKVVVGKGKRRRASMRGTRRSPLAQMRGVMGNRVGLAILCWGNNDSDRDTFWRRLEHCCTGSCGVRCYGLSG